MPKVFISHSSEDKEFVLKLDADLRDAGIDTWICERQIGVGNSITERISEGLKKCDYLAIVLSKTSVASGWVTAELGSILVKDLEEGRRLILPVLKDDCEIPHLIKDRMYADFRRSYEYGLLQVLDKIVPNRLSETKDGLKRTLEDQKDRFPSVDDLVIEFSKQAIDNSGIYSIASSTETVATMLSHYTGAEKSPGDFYEEFVGNLDPTLQGLYFQHHGWKCTDCGASNIDPYVHCHKCGAAKT